MYTKTLSLLDTCSNSLLTALSCALKVWNHSPHANIHRFWGALDTIAIHMRHHKSFWFCSCVYTHTYIYTPIYKHMYLSWWHAMIRLVLHHIQNMSADQVSILSLSERLAIRLSRNTCDRCFFCERSNAYVTLASTVCSIHSAISRK